MIEKVKGMLLTVDFETEYQSLIREQNKNENLTMNLFNLKFI
jgi:hypothetical protein